MPIFCESSQSATSDNKGESLCRVDAGLALGIIRHNIRRNREDACDVYRETIGIVDAAKEKELRRSVIDKQRREVKLREVLSKLRDLCVEKFT